MYKITKSWKFHAGHRLLGLEKDHKCSRIHGHTYEVTVCLGSKGLDHAGMVVDYAHMTDMMKDFLNQWDHRLFLGHRDPLVAVLRKAGEEESLTVLQNNPTAEVLARLLFDGWQRILVTVQGEVAFDGSQDGVRLLWVEVKESESSSARIEQ